MSEAIARASRAEDIRGKRHDHQFRLPRSAPREIQRRLERTDLRGAASFEDLHDRIDSAIGDINQVAELMIYDTALRIGAHLGLSPTRVYLHCGTRAGAKALGLNYRAKSLSMDEIPAALRKLTPAEVEDSLCIYKDEFGALRHDAGT